MMRRSRDTPMGGRWPAPTVLRGDDFTSLGATECAAAFRREEHVEPTRGRACFRAGEAAFTRKATLLQQNATRRRYCRHFYGSATAQPPPAIMGAAHDDAPDADYHHGHSASMITRAAR